MLTAKHILFIGQFALSSKLIFSASLGPAAMRNNSWDCSVRKYYFLTTVRRIFCALVVWRCQLIIWENKFVRSPYHKYLHLYLYIRSQVWLIRRYDCACYRIVNVLSRSILQFWLVCVPPDPHRISTTKYICMCLYSRCLLSCDFCFLRCL